MQILDISPLVITLHDWLTLRMFNCGVNMKNLNLRETPKVSGGTSNLELEIPLGFKRLIEAIEEYGSFPKELVQVIENRAHSAPRKESSYRQRPQRIAP